MLEADLFRVFLEPLNQAGFPHMVTGSVASMLYGRPRMTHDIDLVIQLSLQQGDKLEQLYPKEAFYCPPAAAIRTELTREARGQFNIIHLETGFKADFYPVGLDMFMDWALQRRQTMVMGTMPIWVAPVEYIIVQKLRYFQEGGSSKHITDIQAMLELSAVQMDKSVLECYINKFGLNKEWEKVRIRSFDE